jgi:hypothetical protein
VRQVQAALESTGVDWWPVYHALAQAGIEVCVCNAAHMRNVPGRKRDAADCWWIAELHEHGLLQPGFIPHGGGGGAAGPRGCSCCDNRIATMAEAGGTTGGNASAGAAADGADPRPAAVTFVTTEHFTLQGARAATIAESTGRATMFLGSVSAGLVALALIATAPVSARRSIRSA